MRAILVRAGTRLRLSTRLAVAQSLKWIEPVTEELNGAALALPWRCPELLECENYGKRTRIF